MVTAIYPGSFDPVTYGHLDIIYRAYSLFDKVVVGVFTNPDKNPLFSVEERIALLRKAIPMDDIEIVKFNGLLAEYTKRHGINAVIRGLRAVSDFEYEFQMALTNHKLNSQLETIFLPSREEYTYLSSFTVKTIAKHGGDISSFVPSVVAKELNDKYLGERLF